MRRELIIAVAAAGALIGLAYLWFHQTSSREEKAAALPVQPQMETIPISIDMWIGFGPLVLGKEKGLFEERGVHVEPVVITGTGEKSAAMVAKRVLGRTEGLDSIVLAGNQGAPGTVVLVVDESRGGDGIVAANDIASVADLQGRTVAFQSGLPGHFFLLYLLHGQGLGEDDIQAQIMDSSAAGAAFLAGKVDAAATWEPWLSKAAASPDGHILTSTREHRGVIVDVLAVHPDFLRDHRETVRRVLLGWFDSIEYWRENRDESNAIMADFFGLPVEELEAILDGVGYCDLPCNLELFGQPDAPGKLYEVGETAGAIWHETGVLDGPLLPIDQLIDRSLIDGLLQERSAPLAPP